MGEFSRDLAFASCTTNAARPLTALRNAETLPLRLRFCRTIVDHPNSYDNRWPAVMLGTIAVLQSFRNVWGQVGRYFRLDRHPTMSCHPATPMMEADLRRHFASLGLKGARGDPLAPACERERPRLARSGERPVTRLFKPWAGSMRSRIASCGSDRSPLPCREQASFPADGRAKQRRAGILRGYAASRKWIIACLERSCTRLCREPISHDPSAGCSGALLPAHIDRSG